jgi:hypothetical protein
MNRFGKITLLLCGLLLMLAAFPVRGQDPGPKDSVIINKRPLKDFVDSFNRDLQNKKLDLDAPFTVVMSADLAKGQDGSTRILTNPTLLKSEGDPRMRKLVQDGILAIGDSGWFSYLATSEDVKKVGITVIQDGSEFKASVTAERKTDQLAQQTASGLNLLISLGKVQLTGPDDKALLESTTVSSTGKTFTISFALPKKVMMEMVKRKMNEAAERGKVNSAALARN